MLTILDKAYPAVREYRIVDGSRYRHVSQRFYADTTEELRSLGFRFLGDIEDVTVAQSPGPDPRTFIRVMVDRQATTLAGFYHIAPPFFWKLAMVVFRLPSKVVDLESFAQSGASSCTTTAPAKASVPRPAQMQKTCMPRTPNKELYLAHCRGVAALGPLKPVPTLEQAIERQVELHAALRDHFASIGWLTKEYIHSQGASDSLANDVYNEAQQLLREGFVSSKASN